MLKWTRLSSPEQGVRLMAGWIVHAYLHGHRARLIGQYLPYLMQHKSHLLVDVQRLTVLYHCTDAGG